MKRILIFAFIILIGNSAFAGNTNELKESSATKLISGKVIDQQTGEEIAGAEIIINNTTHYTDLNGNFSVLLPITKNEAIVKFISYDDLNLTIDPVSYAPIIVELKSK